MTQRRIETSIEIDAPLPGVDAPDGFRTDASLESVYQIHLRDLT